MSALTDVREQLHETMMTATNDDVLAWRDRYRKAWASEQTVGAVIYRGNLLSGSNEVEVFRGHDRIATVPRKSREVAYVVLRDVFTRAHDADPSGTASAAVSAFVMAHPGLALSADWQLNENEILVWSRSQTVEA